MNDGTESGDFWSRRKRAVEAEKQADIEAREDERADEAAKALEEKSDEEVLAELDLPDPDSLGKGDDFSAFMAKAVPERLRRRALRRLWLSNPVLANLDELLEYGEDFTDAATVVADLQSVYRVGKGMVRDEDLVEAAGDEAEPEAEPAEEEAAGEPEEPEVASGPEQTEEDAPEPEQTEPEEDVPPEPRARRHMRFAFAGPDGAATGGMDE